MGLAEDDETMKTITIICPAGVTHTFAVTGRYMRILQGAAPVKVQVDNGSQFDLELGVGAEFPDPFTTVQLTSDTAQTIKLAVSDLRVDDNRLVGVVDIQGGLDTKEVEASTNAASAVTVGTSAVQISAANASRKSIIVQAIGGDIFIGGANTVTTATGLKVAQGGSFESRTQGAIWARAATAGLDVRVWQELL